MPAGRHRGRSPPLPCVDILRHFLVLVPGEWVVVEVHCLSGFQANPPMDMLHFPLLLVCKGKLEGFLMSGRSLIPTAHLLLLAFVLRRRWKDPLVPLAVF